MSHLKDIFILITNQEVFLGPFGSLTVFEAFKVKCCLFSECRTLYKDAVCVCVKPVLPQHYQQNTLETILSAQITSQ